MHTSVQRAIPKFHLPSHPYALKGLSNVVQNKAIPVICKVKTTSVRDEE